MFNPSRDQVRSFFIDTWRKHRAREVLTTMESIAADIISLHLLSTPKTAGIINAALIAKMKPTALLINTARGAVLDNTALADALLAGRPRKRRQDEAQ